MFSHPIGVEVKEARRKDCLIFKALNCRLGPYHGGSGAKRKIFMPSADALKRLKQILRLIYSRTIVEEIFAGLKNLMDVYGKDEVIREKRKRYGDRPVLSEKDAFLITYADTLYGEGERLLCTLRWKTTFRPSKAVLTSPLNILAWALKYMIHPIHIPIMR